MTGETAVHAMFENLESRYQYDTSYMQTMHKVHPEAFASFMDFLPMAQFHKHLPLDVYFVAKVAALQEADCGACLQLNVRMALEAGIDAVILEDVIQHKPLTPNLELVNNMARAVAKHDSMDPDWIERFREAYGDQGLVELSLAVASVGVFPAIKRSLGVIQACQFISVSP